MSRKLTVFAQGDVAPTLDHPRRERLVSGDPLRTTWELYAERGVSAGIWACEPGAWRIAFADDTDEVFHVLAGRLRITDSEGEVREFGPGDGCLIPAGFTGVFEVIEAVRKHYVFIERRAAA